MELSDFITCATCGRRIPRDSRHLKYVGVVYCSEDCLAFHTVEEDLDVDEVIAEMVVVNGEEGDVAHGNVSGDEQHSGKYLDSLEEKCRICGSDAKWVGDQYGGVVKCEATGEALFDW